MSLHKPSWEVLVTVHDMDHVCVKAGKLVVSVDPPIEKVAPLNGSVPFTW